MHRRVLAAWVVSFPLLDALTAPDARGADEAPCPSPNRAEDLLWEALGRSDLRAATFATEQLVGRRPSDRAWPALAAALREAVRAETQSLSARAGAVRLADPVRTAGDSVSSSPAGRSGPSVDSKGSSNNAGGLREVRVTKNLVTDHDAWRSAHGLRSSVVRGAVPLLYGSDYQKPYGLDERLWFVHEDHDIAVYESGNLVARARGKEPLVFQPSTHMLRHKLAPAFAQGSANTLFVYYLPMEGTFTRAGVGQVVAYDATTGAVLWATEPRALSSRNFAIVGDGLVVGSGGSGAPDSIHVYDLASGELRRSIPVKSAPDEFALKGDILHVRTYDRNYVYSASGSAAPPMRFPRPSPPVAASAVCTLQRTLESFRRNDADEASRLAATLARSGVHETLANQMRVAALSLGPTPARGMASLDLFAVEPAVVAEPPWQAASNVKAPSKVLPAPKLKAVPAKPAPQGSPVEPVPVAETGPARRDIHLAPVERGAIAPGTVLPAGLDTVPPRYGLEHLRGVYSSDNRVLLNYGGRYLVSVDGRKVESVVDAEALRHPPKANPQWAEFAVQDITHALREGDTLYVCNGGGSYARDVFGKKGFVTALDARTGALRWRSAPLTCGATLVLTGDHLITGYGFTAEPDFLHVLRKADGKAVARHVLPSAPSSLTLEGDALVVDTYGGNLKFSLK